MRRNEYPDDLFYQSKHRDSTVLLVLPVTNFILGFLILFTDFILYFTGVISLSIFIIALHLSFIMLSLSIFSYVIIYLLYQNRNQALGRPIYLVDEASEDLEVE